MLWSSSLLPDAFARAFAPVPDVPLDEWADNDVWLENKAAAEAGPYRSNKTPWNKRIQRLIQNPRMHCWDFAAGAYVPVQVKEINSMKCSQGGLSEAAMNGIRFCAKFRPRNVIYTIDTRESAKDIAERLLPSLQKLDANIFTGDDEDIGTFVMRLRAMDIWFQGSFSTGKFASKQAPFVIADEVEEHGTETKDTSTITNLRSRKKCADNGLQINLCKPKLHKGPIHKAFLRGNQEEYHVRCPHCRAWQPLTFFRNEDDPAPRLTAFSEEIIEIHNSDDGHHMGQLILQRPLPIGETRVMRTGRLVFDHCKDLLGRWDKLRILRETFYECGYCQGKIHEHQKTDLLNTARWLATALGTPGVISQHINDLYSTDANSSWGQIVLEYLDAKREGRRELQGFWNHRLGWPWRDQVNKTEVSDLRASIAGRHPGDPPPYRRGLIPFYTYPGEHPSAIVIIGSDVGGNYAKWAAGVAHPNLSDVAVFDWGEELDPESIAEIMLRHSWPMAFDPEKRLRPSYGFLDAKFRRTDCYRACLAVPGHILIPTTGLGGTAAKNIRLWSYSAIPTYGKKFKKLDYNDREAKDEMYIERIKKRRRRLFLPVDLEEDPGFIAELTAEEIIEDPDTGRTKWNEHPGPNHWGDCVKDIVTGLRFLTRKHQPYSAAPEPTPPPVEPVVTGQFI